MSADVSPTTAFPSAVLPATLTDVVGRERDVPAVRAMLATSRLVTLTGAGGSGKTRLALAVAQEWAREPNGPAVAWVELASVMEPAGVPLQVAMAIGARAEGGGSVEQAVVSLVQGREVLLVLDNCEHLVEACAAFVHAILRQAPRLRVLATSREALGVAGERSWLVPTLEVPADGVSLEAARRSGAVQLFEARARDVRPDFLLSDANLAAVLRICRRLDGLPLAIELAAARVAVLTPAQLADRLSDRLAILGGGARTSPSRHRTLRGAVDWSYDLLSEDERLLLGRLSVFVGGFTLETAEAVCGFGALAAERVLDVLAALATKSLVAMQEEQGQARYRLLEIIREYARERQAERDEADALAERHARALLAWLERIEPDVILARAPRLHELDLEHGNLTAALAWSAAARRGDDIGLPLAYRMMWYWYHRQLWDEAFAQSEMALASATAPTDTLRAAAMHGLGVFGLHALNAGCRAWLAEARRLWRQVGNERWYAFTTLAAVVEASLRGDVAEARALAEEVLEVAERQPDPWDGAIARSHAMVPVLNWLEEWERAARLLDEAIAVFRARDYQTGISFALDAQAYVALRRGDLALASRRACESLRGELDRENRWLAGRSLRILASAAHRRGDLPRALRLFGITDGWYHALGASSLTGERQVVNDLRTTLKAEASAEQWRAEYEAGWAMTFREAIAFALEDESAADATTPSAAPEDESMDPLVVGAAPALEVLALGRVRIRREGRELAADDWPYAKPRELLLYLLAHPEGRTREQIGLDFWPEASAAQVKNNFHVTVHHLRKTLGGGDWVRYQKGRYSIAAARVAFDASRFTSDAEEGLRRLRADAEDTEAAVLLARALDRYGGTFLEEEDAGDWHLAVRDRLARLHEQVLLELAEVLSVEGRHAEVAERCRQLLASDPLHEEATRLLMLALARDERRSEALRVFEKLAQDLQRELSARPSQALQRLATAIRAGERV